MKNEAVKDEVSDATIQQAVEEALSSEPRKFLLHVQHVLPQTPSVVLGNIQRHNLCWTSSAKMLPPPLADNVR